MTEIKVTTKVSSKLYRGKRKEEKRIRNRNKPRRAP